MTTTNANPITGEIIEAVDADRSDAQLLEEWAALTEHINAIEPRLRDIKREVMARLEKRGARAMEDPRVDVTLSKGTDVNRALLEPILKLEGIPADKLAEGYTPTHLVEAPPSWNLTKIKALVKYNAAVKKIIEDATYETEPRLSMKLKEEKKV